MTDSTDSSSFAGFPTAAMFEKMWEMMRGSPLGGMGMFADAAQGWPAALPKMMTPLADLDELEKRITDLRTVEQWLKLNLSMLQSSIQAFEVQRATLATLRVFAQTAAETPLARAAPAGDSSTPAGAETAAGAAPFDASRWWHLLQAQFNQLANFAMAQPGETASAAPATEGGGEGTETNAAEQDKVASKGRRAKPAAKKSPKRTA